MLSLRLRKSKPGVVVVPRYIARHYIPVSVNKCKKISWINSFNNISINMFANQSRNLKEIIEKEMDIICGENIG